MDILNVESQKTEAITPTVIVTRKSVKSQKACPICNRLGGTHDSLCPNNPTNWDYTEYVELQGYVMSHGK